MHISILRILLGTLRLIVAGFALLSPITAHAANYDAQYYRRAFAALDAGHADQAATYAQHGRDPILNKVLRAYYMAAPGNDVSFNEIIEFINNNPDWPNQRDILMIAEQKIPANATNEQIINWFSAHPPVTLAGFYRDIDALDTEGHTKDVARLIHTHWVESDFSPDELIAFHSRFERYLTADANEERLDRLLWKNDILNAHRMYSFVDDGYRALSDARLSFANPNASEELVSRVPAQLQSDPGLLYERLKWRVHNHMDDEALSILQHAPEDMGKPELWWEQSQIIIRRLIDNHNYQAAYQLANNHGQTDGKTLTQAEFLAGWLALQFLHQPEDARVHFQTLFDNASTPISRARGAYWLGRSYEALGDKISAQQAYENASALNITYYGQLATARLYDNPIIRITPEASIPEPVRQSFFNRSIVQATQRLYAIGETDRARHFFHAALESCFKRADFILLIEVAYQLRHPDLAIETSKAAHQKNILIATGGFPVLSQKIPHPPDPAFTHALIRQESMFNPEAQSPVGAQGLMQLMPATAKDVAKGLNIKYKATKLEDPSYNLRLGTDFVQHQLDMFDGSYILALAAYNAGPRHVREWIEQFGDPRTSEVDAVDWVEEIPISETRNYVQRIIESLQIYRARLNGGKAPLMIIKDLKR